MKVREPVARPLDVVTLELLLSGSQAFLVGVLMYLAIGIWDDRGVGFGPVAIILALLAIAIGASWLYWLLGGVGWPLAAADVPTAMFLGFGLLLGWQAEGLFRLEGIPGLLALAAAGYGVVCGVFLDSPRRWRWDQRQKPRPGTTVPRVSPTTRALVAQLPRSLPGRAATPAPATGRAGTRPEQTAAASGTTGIPYLATEAPGPSKPPPGAPAEADAASPAVVPAGREVHAGGPAAQDAGAGGTARRSGRADRAQAEVPDIDVTEPGRAAEATDAAAAIELPASLEPRAQRSPWAWAAPPEWNREEDDEPPRGRPSGRS